MWCGPFVVQTMPEIYHKEKSNTLNTPIMIVYLAQLPHNMIVRLLYNCLLLKILMDFLNEN